MTSFKDLKYRSVYDGIIISRNKKGTVGLFNSIDDIKKIYLNFWKCSDKTGTPYNFSKIYPDLFCFEFNCFVENYPKEIRWSENGLCFIVLTDGRVLVGAPRILMKKEEELI